jgi:hypothetical protein
MMALCNWETQTALAQKSRKRMQQRVRKDCLAIAEVEVECGHTAANQSRPMPAERAASNGLGPRRFNTFRMRPAASTSGAAEHEAQRPGRQGGIATISAAAGCAH